MLRGKIGRAKVVIRQLKGAWNLEEKLRRKEGSIIAQVCSREVMDKERKGNMGRSKWEEEIYELRFKCFLQVRCRERQEIE